VKTSLATLMLLMGADAIEVSKKNNMISIDINKTAYKSQKLMQMDDAPHDPIFLSQYNDAINLAQNKDHISLVQRSVQKTLDKRL
jgi:hypothetical protein